MSDLEAWCNIDFDGDCANPLVEACNLYLDGTIVTEVTIPESITEIKYSTFANAQTIEKVIFHDGITSIGVDAFYGCVALQSLDLPSSLTTIAREAFAACRTLQSLNLPSGLTTICDYAFDGCSAVKSIIIPASVTSIGWNTFSTCSSLKNVTVAWETPLEVPHSVFGFNESRLKLYYPKGTGALYKNADVWKNFLLYSEYDPTGIESVSANANATANARKFLQNGRVIIEKNGTHFTTSGAEIK